MTTLPEPKLDAPGAGLSPSALFFARIYFRLKCLTGSREKFIAGFETERARIRALVDPCALSQRGVRILIPRLPGLEDSSRYHSIWMTLDHLRITNLAFAGVIQELSQGRVPGFVASTAKVKPDPGVGEEVDALYEKSCDHFLHALTAVGELDTSVRYRHPWFGPLNGYRWLAITRMHMSIHRAQIAAIIRRLP